MGLHNIKEKADKIIENIEKVIVGKRDIIELLLTSLFAGGHVLIEDVPGTGKTLLAKSLSKSINCDFKRIQFTPDLLPSDVTGLNYFNQKQGEFVFREGPIFTNIILADEINRATPRTQSSLLECMEEKQVTIDGKTYEMNCPFFVIATQNPIETVGTFPLPEAQLDRFIMKVKIGYPDANQENEMLDRFIKNDPFKDLSYVLDKNEITDIMNEIKNVYVSPQILQYIVNIVNLTRNYENIVVGVSPRGSIAFMRAAQSYAAIKGRDYVIPEDIKYLAIYVLSHRIVVRSSFDIDKTNENYIEMILNNVEVPTEKFSN